MVRGGASGYERWADKGEGSGRSDAGGGSIRISNFMPSRLAVHDACDAAPPIALSQYLDILFFGGNDKSKSGIHH